MSRRRAALPDIDVRHLNGLQVLNETGYDGKAIRSLVVRALRAQQMQVIGAVRVVYSSSDGGHHGLAALGDSEQRSQGLNMSLSLPRDPARLDVGKFARVIRHEAMHWRGIRHEDMTRDQLHCDGPTPEWARDVVVAHRARSVPDKDARRARRLAHAQEMLKRARTRLRRAATIVKRWERRVRAAARTPDPMLAYPIRAAADGSES